MKKKIILSIFLLILILTGLGVYCINGDKISKNVYVQNINIGDLTKDEAKDKLSSEYKIQSFKFNYKEKTWDIDPKTLDINYDLDKTINKTKGILNVVWAIKILVNPNSNFTVANIIKRETPRIISGITKGKKVITFK